MQTICHAGSTAQVCQLTHGAGIPVRSRIISRLFSGTTLHVKDEGRQPPLLAGYKRPMGWFLKTQQSGVHEGLAFYSKVLRHELDRRSVATYQLGWQEDQRLGAYVLCW